MDNILSLVGLLQHTTKVVKPVDVKKEIPLVGFLTTGPLQYFGLLEGAMPQYECQRKA